MNVISSSSRQRPPTTCSSSKVSKSCRGAPSLRTIMRSFSHKNRRQAKTRQPSSHSLDIATTETSVSSPPLVRYPHHRHSTHLPPHWSQQPQPQPQRQVPKSRRQQPQQQTESFPSCQVMSSSPSSSPIKCKELFPVVAVDDTISHESVDWTNTTEGTSFSSEHDDEVVVAAAVTTTTATSRLMSTTTTTITNDYTGNNLGNNNNVSNDNVHQSSVKTVQSESSINNSCGDDEEDQDDDDKDDTMQNDHNNNYKKEKAATDVNSTSSPSSSSAWSSSFTCNTSECAIKLLQRDNVDDDVNDDDASWNDLPIVITLINDDDHDHTIVHHNNSSTSEADQIIRSDYDSFQPNMSPLTLISRSRQLEDPLKQASQSVTPATYPAMLRLERAEVMLESYRNTLRSNEHLIESLEQTLWETRESAQDLWAQRNRLEQELEQTLHELEEEGEDWIRTTTGGGLLRQIHTVLLAFSLVYAMIGGGDYMLIVVAMIYLLEDVMAMGW